MRTDILEFHEYYRTALGAATRDFIREHLRAAWGDGAGLAIAGFGYANPFLEDFDKAERTLALSPGSQGIIRWPTGKKNSACLVGENGWPLPDASLDRILIVHGLEESPDPHKLMREAWRVLADDGRMIIISSHRRGLWSIIDSTPFAAGRPYLRGQLNRLLESAMFCAEKWSAALYFPPLKTKFLLRAARSWERAGARVWPGLSGVILVEAKKDLLAPAIPVRSAKERALRPALASPHATTLDAKQ